MQEEYNGRGARLGERGRSTKEPDLNRSASKSCGREGILKGNVNIHKAKKCQIGHRTGISPKSPFCKEEGGWPFSPPATSHHEGAHKDTRQHDIVRKTREGLETNRSTTGASEQGDVSFVACKDADAKSAKDSEGGWGVDLDPDKFWEGEDVGTEATNSQVVTGVRSVPGSKDGYHEMGNEQLSDVEGRALPGVESVKASQDHFWLSSFLLQLGVASCSPTPGCSFTSIACNLTQGLEDYTKAGDASIGRPEDADQQNSLMASFTVVDPLVKSLFEAWHQLLPASSESCLPTSLSNRLTENCINAVGEDPSHCITLPPHVSDPLCNLPSCSDDSGCYETLHSQCPSSPQASRSPPYSTSFLVAPLPSFDPQSPHDAATESITIMDDLSKAILTMGLSKADMEAISLMAMMPKPALEHLNQHFQDSHRLLADPLNLASLTSPLQPTNSHQREQLAVKSEPDFRCPLMFAHDVSTVAMKGRASGVVKSEQGTTAKVGPGRKEVRARLRLLLLRVCEHMMKTLDQEINSLAYTHDMLTAHVGLPLGQLILEYREAFDSWDDFQKQDELVSRLVACSISSRNLREAVEAVGEGVVCIKLVTLKNGRVVRLQDFDRSKGGGREGHDLEEGQKMMSVGSETCKESNWVVSELYILPQPGLLMSMVQEKLQEAIEMLRTFQEAEGNVFQASSHDTLCRKHKASTEIMNEDICQIIPATKMKILPIAVPHPRVAPAGLSLTPAQILVALKEALRLLFGGAVSVGDNVSYSVEDVRKQFDSLLGGGGGMTEAACAALGHSSFIQCILSSTKEYHIKLQEGKDGEKEAFVVRSNISCANEFTGNPINVAATTAMGRSLTTPVKAGKGSAQDNDIKREFHTCQLLCCVAPQNADAGVNHSTSSDGVEVITAFDEHNGGACVATTMHSSLCTLHINAGFDLGAPLLSVAVGECEVNNFLNSAFAEY
ncbi:hypothetical protein CEUSTIGMA_g3495.t1 [Chlamydomonas eustigma]|uniref:Uncharacterized protein n=1 Tax=Chlamydomonas eustigma TaxID=1157962 RepID=A0A250WZK8_9CHLO|nr:hypothetical protein CEUSTIGMA_g3495.t1 [Chlamydomonas eustigma]|eukprot:GAX76052.1 hypothetical protein CEUSTIGMA_g3495.t1 [Chlamydomonas eustigma]